MQKLRASAATLVGLWLLASLLSLSVLAQSSLVSSTAFTYQGSLNDGTKQANGLYDLQFALYDAAASGSQQGNFITNSATAVTNGLFTVMLDFSNQFPGPARWLEISIRTNGAAAFVTLAPRQALTPVPYSVTADSVAAGNIVGPLTSSQLPAGIVTNGATAANISGAFSGNGAGLTNAAGSAFLAQSNGVAYGLNIGSPVFGFGTNLNLGEVWLNDYGFSPTNSAAGNSAALDLGILIISNRGGGILRYGGYSAANAGHSQTILLAGEHLFPPLAGGANGMLARALLKGDGSTIIQSTASSTVHAVLWGQFDIDGLDLQGVGTNVSNVYPYTNYVGVYEVGFWNPRIKDTQIQGFGQGLAACQLGSYTGALFDHVKVENCNLGIAVGDQCDALHLVNCVGRHCYFGLDTACCTPIPTNIPVFWNILGAGYNSTNVIGCHSLYVDGGIFAYNQVNFVLGKSVMTDIKGTHIEVTGLNNMWLGHTNPMYQLANEQQGVVYLENNTWSPNSPHGTPATNIVCNALNWTLHASHTIMDPATVGIFGQLQELDIDYSCSLWGTTNYLPNAVAPQGYHFNDLPIHYFASGQNSHTWFEDHNSGSSFSPMFKFDGNVDGSLAGFTVWTAGDVFSDRSDESRVSYIINGRTNNEFSLYNLHLKASAGVGSTATSTAITMGTTGITNITSVNWRILGFTGTSVTQKNLNDSSSFSRNTITTATDITLQPNEALIGTGCAALAVRPW